jgi:hypothetical protein
LPFCRNPEQPLASTYPQAQGQESFGSFLQKRTFFPIASCPGAGGQMTYVNAPA